MGRWKRGFFLPVESGYEDGPWRPAADVGRTESVYGGRDERYVHLEAGHAAQNLLLQATALGLAAVPVGAFDDAGVAGVIGLPAEQAPLYLIPVGHPAGPG